MRYILYSICMMILLSAIPGSFLSIGTYGSFTSLPSREPHEGPASSNISGLYGGIITYEDTALIVNDNSESSKEIGTYFAQRRGLPARNIINITAPTDEVIDFGEFDDMMMQISNTLSERGLTDSIDYLVTTKGVPLKITSGYTNMNDQRYYYGASVDSELMLMDSVHESSIHRVWWIDNPYFDSDQPFSRDTYGIRLVTRLTGYTVEEAKRLVDLAEPSLGVRGEAYLDMDPRKGMGNSGYGVGNKWMNDANDWLVDNNWSVHLDNTNTFQTNMSNVSAYFSWGSNDGDWGENQMTNTGFEYGNGVIPSGWTVEAEGGMIERTTEQQGSGSWSLKMTRNTTGVLRTFQDVILKYPDHRYIADGRMRPDGVTTPGARIMLEGYDSYGNLLWTHTLTNRTGTRNWYSVQDPIENITGTVKVRYIVELLGEGTVYFDQNFMRVIRPHNQWVPGSIAETIVSTGGRSQTYGTWYGQSLIADLIKDGVTGIKGYAWEPFIGAISHADILFPAYYSGYNLAESFWMGSELGSWMGYVVGDPKCTPYLNERPDMGFDPDKPLTTFVDDDGIPHLSLTLYNKGNRPVENGSVELFIDNTSVWRGVASMSAQNGTTLIISSEDEPIIGTHRFRVELNNDEKIREFDGKNNILEMDMVVNSIPNLKLSIERNEVNRTHPLNISAIVGDDDAGISLHNLNIEITGPDGMTFEPEPINADDSGTEVLFMMRFTPPHNATTGFYSIRGRYVDIDGSFAEDHLHSSFKVLNNAPVIFGYLQADKVPRGGLFNVNLTWFDADTVNGILDIDVYASRPIGGKTEPLFFKSTGNNSAIYTFEIPMDESSGSWSVTAEVTDRDGYRARWESIVRTFNLPPTMKVQGAGQNVTRKDIVEFGVRYIDPEKLPSSSIRIRVTGPGDGGEVVRSWEISLEHNESFSLDINPRYLSIGEYALILEFEDDERAGEIISIQPLFTLVPMAPVISEPVIDYEEGNGPPGGVFTRGDYISLSIPVTDPDSVGGHLDVTAELGIPDSTQKDIALDSGREGIFRARLSTDGTWDVGRYSLRVSAVDEDGQYHLLEIDDLFTLNADWPIFDSGKIIVHLNGTVDCEIMLGIPTSSSKPERLILHLFDVNDTLTGTIDLLPFGGFGSFKGTGDVSGKPTRGALLVEDDIGRSIWFNETMDFSYEQKTSQIQAPEEEGEGEDTYLLYIALILIIALMILTSIIVLILMKRQKVARMIAPPPPVIPRSGIGPVMERDALPPGRIMDEGDSSYHRPDPSPEKDRKGHIEGSSEIVPMAPQPTEVDPTDPSAEETTTGAVPDQNPEIIQNNDPL